MFTKRVFPFELKHGMTVGSMPFDPAGSDDLQLDTMHTGVWVIEQHVRGLYLHVAEHRPCCELVLQTNAPEFGVLAIGDTGWYESLSIHAVMDETFCKWREVMGDEPVLPVAFGLLFNTGGSKYDIYTQTADGLVVGVYLRATEGV